MGKKEKTAVKKIFCVFCLLFSAACYCGCSQGKEKQESEARESAPESVAENDRAQEGAQGEKGKKEDDGVELTVWLDEENETDLRVRIANYEVWKQAVPEQYRQYYPDIQWNLVDKGGLTPEQYRKELSAALEEGGGPDIIYMDTYNNVSPGELMENGSLLALGDVTVWRGDTDVEFVEGILEAGKSGGEQYIIPLYMECPVFFGIEEDLKEAGIETEEMYGSLEEFLSALLAAAEKTGKLVLENAEAIDWLEAYDMPEDAAAAKKARELLKKARERCGDDRTAYGAYRMLDGGECLLAGCGVGDFKRMCRNLTLYAEGQTPAFIPAPDGSGGLRDVITCSAGVNAKTAHPEEALAVMQIFQGSGEVTPPDLRAAVRLVTSYSDGTEIADNSELFVKQSCWEWAAAQTHGLSDGLKEQLVSYPQEAAFVFCYAQECGAVDSGRQTGGKERLSVCYTENGDGQDSPVARLLEKTAESYNRGNADVWAQAMRMNDYEWACSYQRMDKYGLAPDMAFYETSDLRPDPHVSEADVKSADFASLFEARRDETPPLPENFADGVQYENGVTGLPLAAETFGIWYSRSAAEKAGLPEEWEPADMEGLTEGLEKLNALSQDGEPYAAMLGNVETAKAMSMFAVAPEELLKRREDGAWELSETGWTEYLSFLTEWRDKGLVKPVGNSFNATTEDILRQLADGVVGAYIGSSAFSAWIDGDALPLTKEQKEDLAFVRLSPAVDMQMLFVSAKSERVEEAFSFWLTALQLPEYAALIKEEGYVPVTELDDDVINLPCEAGSLQSEMLTNLWNTEKTAEELAEKYKWFDYAQEEGRQ